MKSILFSLVILGTALTAHADSAQQDADPSAGEKVYNGTCIACHGEDGEGAIPGTPNLTKSNSVLESESDKVLLAHILDGFQASGSPLAMPPKGGDDSLTIADIKNVLAYLHERFHYKKF